MSQPLVRADNPYSIFRLPEALTCWPAVSVMAASFLVAALAAIGALTYVNRAPQSEDGLVREVIVSRHPVQTLVIRPSTLNEKLVFTGVLDAKQDVIISAEVAGRVLTEFKELGDLCKKGEV